MYEIKFEDTPGKDSHTIVQIFNKTNKDIAYKVNPGNLYSTLDKNNTS